MTFEVFKPLADTILEALKGWATISDSMIGSLHAPIMLGLTIRLIWQGLNAMRGVGGRLVIVDAALGNLRVLLVWWAALAAGSYTANVQGFLLGLRSDLSGLFVPGAGDGYVALDQMMTKATEALSDIYLWSADNISFVPAKTAGIVALLCGLGMVTCMAIFALVACVNLLFVDLAISFLLAIGPLFVACFAFQSTARFFDSWLGAVLKYVFSSVLITAIASMAISIMMGYANKLAPSVSELDFVTTTFAALGASGVLIFFAYRAPALAADIAGGIAINAMSYSHASGPVGAAMAAGGSAAKSMAGAAANVVGFAAGAAASTAAGQAIAGSAPAQGAMAVANTVGNAASVLGGSLGQAFAAGRGGSISGGSGGSSPAPGNDRPLGSPSGSRSLPPVSAAQNRAASNMSLAA